MFSVLVLARRKQFCFDKIRLSKEFNVSSPLVSDSVLMSNCAIHAKGQFQNLLYSLIHRSPSEMYSALFLYRGYPGWC